MRGINLFSIAVILLFSCQDSEVDNKNFNTTESDGIISEKSNLEIDAKAAAEISLKFDALQPLAATTGKKEYSNQLDELNMQYKKIEDKYIDRKVEFTSLVSQYRSQILRNK